MNVVSASPLQVGSLRWQTAAGRHTLTVVAKLTFELVPGEARLAEVQDFPNEEDNHWNDDPRCSLYSASDLVPFKRKADVVLVGEAFAPGGEPVRSLVARLVVGSIEKVIEVHRDRHFTQQGELVEGPRFTRMPLRYERTAGGAHTANPVGIDPEGERDLYGRLAVPNLTRPGVTVRNPLDASEPVGFGPIAPSWPTRRATLGHHAAGWSERGWMAQPLPADLDPSFFNAAPMDQRLDELREDERLVLENMHPHTRRLVCHLPGIKPRVFVERQGAARELPMRADTLWIDTSRALCTLTWRGRVDLEQPHEPGRVVAAMEKPGARLSWPEVRKLVGPAVEIADENTADVEPPGMLPEHTAGVGLPNGQALPFQRAQRTSAFPMPSSTESARSGATGAIPVIPPDRSPSWLQKGESGRAPSSHPVARAPSAPPPAARASSAPPPAARPVASVQAMPMRPERPSSAPPPANLESTLSSSVSPWAARSSSEAPAAAVGHPLGAPAIVPPNPAEALREQPVAPPVERLAPEKLARPRQAHEVVELLWYAPEAMPRIREERRWADLLEELRRRRIEQEPLDFDEEPPSEEPQEVRDRRTVVTLMTRARVTGAFDLQQTMLDGVDPSGNFEAPLVLMSGRLQFPFDQLETLKATLAAVTPLIAGNQELQSTVDAVNELLKTPWLQEGSGEVAEGLTEKVRNAFKRGDRIVDPGYLDEHTERILLERRCYQKRKLFGAEWIRGLLSPPSSRAKIPTYVPEKLATELPMYKAFQARVMAEAHVQQDQYEAHECALKVVAFGRVVTFTRSQAY